MNRFYEINSGEITIDKRNINEYTLESLRKQIAIVLQDVFLFSDSIYNNITLHNETISREDVIEILGRTEYLSGIARSAFHGSASRETNDNKNVYFDSSNLFR